MALGFRRIRRPQILEDVIVNFNTVRLLPGCLRKLRERLKRLKSPWGIDVADPLEEEAMPACCGEIHKYCPPGPRFGL